MANPNALRDEVEILSYGPQWIEDWTDPRAAQAPTRGLDAVWESEQGAGAASPLIPITAADDGVMGSRYMRYAAAGESPIPAQCNLVPRKFFDALSPVLYKFRQRVVGGAADFASYGVLYHGEGSYNGATSNTYGIQIGAQRNVIADVEIQWLPATRRIRVRKRLAGELAGPWEPWVTDDTPTTEDILWFGPSIWWGCFDTVELGTIRAYGEPVWGCCDHIGFGRWVFTGNSAWYGAQDNLGYLGGICYGTNDTYLGNAVGDVLLATATEWGPAYSPTIGRHDSVDGYSKLRFVVPQHDAGEGSYVRIYLRDATTDALLPDAQVPGNSTGIVSSSSAVSGLVGGGASAWVREIDISAIPAGVEFYIEVRGKTRSTSQSRTNNPRLGAIQVLFDHAKVITLPASDPTVYNKSRLSLWSAGINLATANIVAILVTSGYTPDIDNHQYVSHLTNELSGGGYARKTLSGKALAIVGTGETAYLRLTSDAPEWTPVGSSMVHRRVIFAVNTGNDATSPLLSWCYSNAVPQDVTTLVGYKLRISPGVRGWLNG